MIKGISLDEFAGPIHVKVVDMLPQSDWDCSDPKSPYYIKNKPTLTINGKEVKNGSITITANDIRGTIDDDVASKMDILEIFNC